jgi:phosphatidylglycerol:prolipoprotein diacylglycerol transferase
MTIPTTLTLGPLTLHVYGLILGLGFVAALQVINIINKQTNLMSEKKLNTLVWMAILGGIIGARIYHVVDAWEYYRTHLALIPQVWHGGLGIYGGMFGGMVALVVGAFFMRFPGEKRGIKTTSSVVDTLRTWLDLAALGLPLGQAIGRFGNWVNQELYGLPSTLPWSIYISPENRLSGVEQYSHFHPLFAYEAFWMLFTFILFYGVFYRHKNIKLGTGVYALGYIASYAAIRFGLDFFRLDPWRLGALTVAQWISLVLLAVVAGILLKARRAMIRYI